MSHGPLWRFIHRPRTKKARQRYRDSNARRASRDAGLGIRPGQRGGRNSGSKGWGPTGWLVLACVVGLIILYLRRHTG